VQDLRSIEEKMFEIRKAFYGDQVASELDKAATFPVASRAGWLVNEMWSSTAAPTGTQREALRIAREQFRPILSDIRTLVNEDIEALEQKLEEAGAPYTPGRSVDYGGQ